MGSTRQNILNTLAYFDIFQYPLLKEEILLFHSVITDQRLIDESLDDLCNEGTVFKLDEFYSIQNGMALAQRRRTGNRLAFEQMKNAHRAAKILARFPYVRGLAISGSLSKNYADENTDIDFFIITKANRLWLARTLMHLFYKLHYFTGKQRWFCMNYYVDEAGLEIEEKNIFTAIEIITLLPMHGKTALDDFMLANKWANDYFPHCRIATADTAPIKKRIFSRMTEWLFNNRLGDWVDRCLMKITDKRWRKKVERKQKNVKGNPLGMIVTPHCSKPNPIFFQDKVLQLYVNKIGSLTRFQKETSNV